MKELEKDSIIRALVVVKKATAQANKDFGMNCSIGDAISKACDEILNETDGNVWDNDLSSTDMNLNKKISERATHILKEESEDSTVIEPADVSKHMSEHCMLSTAMYVAIALNIQESVTPALKKLEDSIKGIFERVKDIVKVGRVVPSGSEPPTLGDEFRRYIKKIDSDLEFFEILLSEVCYLELDNTVERPEEFTEKLANFVSEFTGVTFRVRYDYDFVHTLVEISLSLNSICDRLKEMTVDINYFPNFLQYELNEINVIIKDLEEGSVVLREDLVPTHRDILVAISTHLAYNHSNVVFAVNSYTRYKEICFKRMIAIYLLRSLKLIAHGIIFVTNQFHKAASPVRVKSFAKPKTPCLEFGKAKFKKIFQ